MWDRIEEFRERRHDVAALSGPDPNGLGRELCNVRRVTNFGEIHEHRDQVIRVPPTGRRAAGVAGDLDCEPGLPGATRSHEGDETVPGDQLAELDALVGPAAERVREVRQWNTG